MAPGKRRRTGRWITVGAALALVSTVLVVLVVKGFDRPSVAGGPPCQATVDGQTYGLDLDQAANATTIAAVGKRDGLPDHAVTVALATALQESGLRNLSYGDRDSLGLFQQRPSQGWGTAEQVSTPSYAAAAFYGKLKQVPGWQALDVTEAAQQVQRSASPSAYARWEDESRVLARALTGEVPGAFACRVSRPKPSVPSAQLAGALTAEVGPSATAAAPTPAQGWTTASWAVGHAADLHVSSVTFGGRRWTARTGTWSPAEGAPADGPVEIA
ncbi:MAG: hypothetical protein ACXWBN_14135 [Acidimicrobiales bacterium]